MNDELLEDLVRTSFAVMAVLNRVAAENDLSLTQLRALAILRDREPTMAQLADYLGLERSSVSGLMDRAVRRGLARKTASREDARSVHVTLTAEGQRQSAEIAEKVAGLLAPMTTRLSAAEQKRLGALLAGMLDPAPPVTRPDRRHR
ncbi:DNA-binding MarR family transcriptional regulator [Mycolicibacterium sp. BK556]|uniref:MarR family winged helix-turn-helix transcriptional regulator n=1 Tax=Mycobacteriaceae TaxID=1762 RepID=UPI0010D7A513|nr:MULTISPECIES: MarR family transcriptional regulator [Mycobacteriaceae]MBB3606668.1 DNA-binding MarR family transcriptional regulator [Mycolicibacterium sp. BK556]MBB3636666.1 DNA-binding MarR family transcriptional regulator [Mycolicibacterium sp. BK607]MBB3754248.1 DNA-binding MarR family transcriptional regulator [Mycolicibacterium sp. BK634]TDO17110.1 DNA-binding MarR family transcriptional regulator [Mycobacterium sp. BK086]